MNVFSIAQLARFSGIKAHTIRMWERRYNALSPRRSQGNTRYYDGDQLRRLLNIASLHSLDFKLPELAAMADEDLFRLVREQMGPHDAGYYEYYISRLVAAGLSFDEPGFDKVLDHCIIRYGVGETYENIMYPMLNRVGLMWSCDEIPPAHEHFISNLIRQKLLVAVDALPFPEAGGETWLLFLPEDELHETSLLFAHFLVRQSGRKAVYLGSNLPLPSLQESLKAVKPTHLLLFFVRKDSRENRQAYLDELKKQCPGETILVCGDESRFEGLIPEDNFRFITSVEGLKEEFKQTKNK